MVVLDGGRRAASIAVRGFTAGAIETPARWLAPLFSLVRAVACRSESDPALRDRISPMSVPSAMFSVEIDAAGNLKPSKKKSTERLDGLAAGTMGILPAEICATGLRG